MEDILKRLKKKKPEAKTESEKLMDQAMPDKPSAPEGAGVTSKKKTSRFSKLKGFFNG